MGQNTAGRTIMILGQRCRELRLSQGLSREALAGLSSGRDALSVATIKRAEAGRAIYPGSATALARTLGVPLTELLIGSDAKSETSLDVVSASQSAIAVMPFEAIGGDPETTHFAEGLAADIIHRLGAFW